MMTDRYILEGHTPVPCEDLISWGQWLEHAAKDKSRIVAQTIVGDYRVSTVFLGLDHNFNGGPPLLFESMIFPKNSYSEIHCERYSTWDDAEEGHKRAVEIARKREDF